VAAHLAHHKQPREIHFVDAVPRTPSGKILRRELRKTLA
jgi:fatty-acyl-CoA synthase